MSIEDYLAFVARIKGVDAGEGRRAGRAGDGS
jgi:hypothetical protein